MSTGKRGAEGQGWASTGSSISPCDAVCSCLISCTRHSGSFPGSGHSGGSRAPFQTQHPLQPGFENQLSLPSFRCLRRAFPSRPERWEHQDVDGKTHPANIRLPEETPPSFQGAQEPQEEQERIDPTLLQPHHHPAPWLPHSAAFEASFLHLLPPTQRRLARSRSGHAVGWGVPGTGRASPAPRARCLAPVLAQARRNREVFCPFRQSFSASLRRRAHSLSELQRSRSSPSDLQRAGRGGSTQQPGKLWNSSSKPGL